MAKSKTVKTIAPEAFVLPEINALALIGAGSPSVRTSFSKETNPVTGFGDVAPWGVNNLFPQEVMSAVEKHSFVGSVLDWKVRALYGGGLVYGKLELDEKGNETFKRDKDSAIDDFLRKSNFTRSYLTKAITGFYYLYNIFPELIMDRAGEKIADLNCLDPVFCRWKVQNAQGFSDTAFYNVNWNSGGTAETSVKIAAIDPFYDSVGQLRDGWSAKKFIYPVSYPSLGKNYYALAHWNSMRESGWMEVSNRIAKYKDALLKNQFTVKYLIETTNEFWEFKFPGYKDMKKEDKVAKQTEVLATLSNYLKGESNTGNSILTTKFTDPITKQQMPGLSITAIDDKLKDGAYIEDSQEASSHLLFALGVDGTLIGNAPGKGMGAGSGSDKRVAFNNYISLCEMHRDIILEPLHFIRDVNGWSPDTVFRFKQPMIMTLDKGKEVQQQTS